MFTHELDVWKLTDTYPPSYYKDTGFTFLAWWTPNALNDLCCEHGIPGDYSPLSKEKIAELEDVLLLQGEFSHAPGDFPPSYTHYDNGGNAWKLLSKKTSPIAWEFAKEVWGWSPDASIYVINRHQISNLENQMMLKGELMPQTASKMDVGLTKLEGAFTSATTSGLEMKYSPMLVTTVSTMDAMQAALAVAPKSIVRRPGSVISPRTQKAKGVIALRGAAGHGLNGKHGVWGPSKDTLLLPYQQPQAFPIFLRPCPVTPRHGFVDSREVKSFEELLEVWGDARRADPDCEALAMPRLTGACSAVALNTGVTWGASNDGATGTGKLNRTIPAPVDPKDWNRAIKNWMGLRPSDYGVTDTAYLEIVEHNGKSICVQMRGGPAGVASRDYVPSADYVVSDVLKLEGAPDLLAWEAAVASLHGKPGACVWAPALPLSSHYAVHAITNKVALYAGNSNPAGKTLQPAKDAAKPLVAADYNAISAAMLAWYDMPLSHVAKVLSKCHVFDGSDGGKNNTGASDTSRMTYIQANALETSIAALHSMALWDNSTHLLVMRGFAAMTLARLFAASIIGEARHYHRNGPGRFGATSVMDWGVLLSDEAKKKAPGYECGAFSRSYAYEGATRLGFGTVRHLLDRAHLDLNQHGWGGSTLHLGEQMTIKESDRQRAAGGFSHGGPKWAHAARIGVKLADAVDNFVRNACEKTWIKVVEGMNLTVNCAHNGGVVLDKWVAKDDFDSLAICPSLGFLNIVASQIVLGGNV